MLYKLKTVRLLMQSIEKLRVVEQWGGVESRESFVVVLEAHILHT